MEINPFELKIIMESAAELGALSALIKIGKLKPYVNKSEAFKMFGRATVETWVRDGLIIVRKDGDHSSAWRIDRLEIELLSKVHIIARLT